MENIEEKMKNCSEKFPGQCRCAFRCLGNEFCQDADKRINELKAENEELKKQKEILLNQLIVYDGEDVTIQISQGQFEEYNKLKAENEKLAIRVANLNERFINGFNYNEHRYKQALEDIKHILKIHEKELEECLCNNIDEKILAKINEVIGVEE